MQPAMRRQAADARLAFDEAAPELKMSSVGMAVGVETFPV